VIYTFELSDKLAGSVVAEYECRAVLIGAYEGDWSLDTFEVKCKDWKWQKVPVKHHLFQPCLNQLESERRIIDAAWRAKQDAV
jgi:hypothetical protein